MSQTSRIPNGKVPGTLFAVSAMAQIVASLFLPVDPVVHLACGLAVGATHLGGWYGLRRGRAAAQGLAAELDNLRAEKAQLASELVAQAVRTDTLLSAKEEALGLAARKSEFLANMSHELRTPLNAISGLVELCLSLQPAPKQRNYLDKINTAAHSLLRLVNDVLDFSKADAGRVTLERIPFDLRAVLDNLDAMLVEKAYAHKVELVVDASDEEASHVFVGDPLRLEQVLVNLVSNAIKFSPAGGTVVVTLKVTQLGAGAQLDLAVKDAGIGMSKEHLANLFTPFSQADASTTRKYGGTGLGLAIVKHLVDLMGGTIAVRSEESQGSTFSISLPLELRELAEGNPAAELALAPYRGRQVLVVEDNDKAAEVLVGQLASLGFVGIRHPSGEAAVAGLAASAAPGLYLAAFVDNSLPGLPGIETCRKLRQLAPELPLILMPATSGDPLVTHGAKAGFFDGILLKPARLPRTLAELAIQLGLAQRVEEGAAFHLENPPELLRGAHILVVDDIPINQEILKDLLESVGATVALAGNGYEALVAAQYLRPDCILMDCHMPGMDGYEATQRIMADPELRATPIVAITANSTEVDRRKCLEVGMVDFIPKPAKAGEVFAILARSLARAPGRRTRTANQEAMPAYLLPVLPRIDAAQGLGNCHSPAMYLRTLRTFRDTHCKTFEPEFTRAVKAGDHQTALRAVHSLKGLARTVGAVALGELAYTLEMTVRDGASTTDLEQQLPRLIGELQVVTAGLEAADLATA